MAILGNPIDKTELDKVMQRFSTRIHQLMSEINELDGQLAEIADADIEAIYTTGGSADGVADRTAFRAWQVACKALADNYKGQGAVLNRAFEIAKRVVPR